MTGTDLDAGARGVERREGQDPLRPSRGLDRVRDLAAAGEVEHRVESVRGNAPHSFDQSPLTDRVRDAGHVGAEAGRQFGDPAAVRHVS